MITEVERKKALAEIQKSPNLIFSLSDELKNDKALVLKAISLKRQIIGFISPDLLNDPDIQKEIFYDDIDRIPIKYNKDEHYHLESIIENLKLKIFFGQNFSEQKSQYYSSIISALINSEQSKVKIMQIERNKINKRTISEILIENLGLNDPRESKLSAEEILFGYILNQNTISETTKKEIISKKFSLHGTIGEFHEIFNQIKLKYQHIPGITKQLDNPAFKKLEVLYSLEREEKISAENFNSKLSKVENISSILADIETNLNILSREIWSKTLMNPNEIEGNYIINQNGVKVKEVIFKGQEFNILCHMIGKDGSFEKLGYLKKYLSSDPKEFGYIKSTLSTSLVTNNHMKVYERNDISLLGFGFSNLPLQNYATFCSENASSMSYVTEIENDEYDSNIYVTTVDETTLSKTIDLPNRLIEESKKKDTHNEIVLWKRTEDGPTTPEFVILFVNGEINRKSKEYREAFELADKLGRCITVIDRDAYGWKKFLPKKYNDYGDFNYGGKAPGIKSKDYYNVKFGNIESPELGIE